MEIRLYVLMSGGYIIQNIKEGLTYDYIHSSEENIWSVLYFTGYLTRAKEEVAGKNVFALPVPNAEVMEIFEDAVEEWFSELLTNGIKRPFLMLRGTGMIKLYLQK